MCDAIHFVDAQFASISLSLTLCWQVYAVSSRTIAQRAVLKFAHFTGCTPIAGRFTPGTFTNQAQKGFREPRLLICSDPLTDHQAIFESSYANVPVVAFCNTDARLKYVDVAVPCNTRSAYGIGLMWWLLTREVLRLRGTLSRPEPWSVLPDLYFYRSPEEVAKEEQLQQQQQLAEQQQRQRTAQVDDVADLVAAVVLDDDGDNGRTAAAGGATATTQQQQHRDDEKWPDMFKIADWNETMAVDDEAQRAQNTSAATWGGHNALF